jgi:exodeoxyribonuclease V alpha subunit
VVHLDTIYRQSENSYIAVNAKGILEGENPKSNTREGDFFVINRSKQQDILNEVVALIKSRLKDHYGFDPMNDIQVLSPIKNGIIGTKNLNAVLQDTLNPREDSKPILNFKTREFRLGDKVMQMRNNYFLDWQDTQTLIRGKGVFNGEIGYIIDIDETKKTITTVFDQTKEVVYDIFSFSDLELAYAITVHKSQGSEFKSVIIPISHLPEILSSRNLLYTAVTRAKELVVIIGENIHIKRMIDHFETSTRNSSLVDQINKISNEYI